MALADIHAPKSYDDEGNPLYEATDVDIRYRSMLSDIEAGGGKLGPAEDGIIWELLRPEMAAHRWTFLAAVAGKFSQAADREGSPSLLTPELGALQARLARNEKLRAHPDLATFCAKHGFPEDPADFTPAQLDAASLALLLRGGMEFLMGEGQAGD